MTQMADIQKLKKLREETGASVADIKNALEEASSNEDKAREILKKRGLDRALKKSDREIKAGRVFSYVHHTGTVGGTVVLGCETDFVARTDEFQTLGRELAMQVATYGTNSPDELVDQDYIRDSGKTVGTLVQETIGKLGENIKIVDVRAFKV